MGIVVELDSFLVEIVAIDFHKVAFLEEALHLVQSLVVAADTYAVREVLGNFLEDFYKSKL